MEPLLEVATRALLDYLGLGHECHTADLATFVHDPAVPMVHDANHGAAVTAESRAEIDRVLNMAEEVLAPAHDISFKLTPGVPSAFEARLVLEGYRSSAALEMVLEGPLSSEPPDTEVRAVTGEDDWASLWELKRADDREQAVRTGEARSAELSEQMFLAMKAKAPAVCYFLARVEDRDCAYFSSWPGHGGVGVVEDLFTLPEYRHRGIATALIARAVADSRARGAGPVLIGADPGDTPKQMYAALGFRPLLVMRSYWKRAKER